jgi:tetrahydromethanopterin S-methyltransferase subunit G
MVLSLQPTMLEEGPKSSMSRNDNEFRQRIIRLSSITMGIVLGVFSGLALFIATIWLVLKGGTEVGPHLSLLSQYFPGYSVTVAGSFIGFGYGFVLGLVAGLIVGLIYNNIVELFLD